MERNVDDVAQDEKAIKSGIATAIMPSKFSESIMWFPGYQKDRW
jgi:hypothetical protein